jgi:hypothetical protein
MADQPSRGSVEMPTVSHDSHCTNWIAGSRPLAFAGFVMMTCSLTPSRSVSVSYDVVIPG